MLVNMIGFNFAWFGLVYWGNIFIPVALLMLAIHLLILSDNKNEAKLVLVITVIGVSIDSMLNYSNFFIFMGSGYTPFWLIVLWACFASTVSHSLSFLKHSKLLQVSVGFFIAPLSYIVAGEKFNAVDFSYPLVETYLVLGVIWALLFIVIFLLKSLILVKSSADSFKSANTRSNDVAFTKLKTDKSADREYPNV